MRGTMPTLPAPSRPLPTSAALSAPTSVPNPAPASAPVLVTGFEPFGGESVNPSWGVAQALHGQVIAGWPVVAVQLPCVFATAPGVLRAALRRHRPRAVLCLGLAGSRSAISFERVAVNWVDARMPDNAGAQPVDQPVQARAAAAHFTGLPIKALAQRVQLAGWPAELSFSVGSFVCNQVFFALMQALRRRPGVPGGFIHLPPLPEQAGQHPGTRPMALADQVQALRVVVQALAEGVPELRAAGGRVD